MKRFWTSLAAFSLVEAVGRYPATAGILLLLGVGGGAVIANLTTPTLVPVPAAYFDQNQNSGTATNGLKTPSSNPGSMYPPTDVTGSFAVYGELKVDDAMSYSGSYESPFIGGILSENQYPGLPTFFFQRSGQWWNAPGISSGSSASVTAAGSNYNTGFYPFTATGGGPCSRYPSGVWQGWTTSVQVTDPGFGCATPATMSVAAIPNAGAQQTGVTATCAASAVSGYMNVTTSLAVSPGLSPGMTYNLGGFTTSGGTGWTSGATITLTTVSVSGSGPYTLVGTLAGSCPTISSTGAALSGTGAGTITFPAISTTNPYLYGQTGITTKNGQRICFVLGENGDDVTGANALPGSQFLHMVDENGNALPGAPALVPWTNQGTANFTGYTLANTQSPSSPALTVTALNPYSGSGSWASYSSTTGYVTFTTTSSPGLVPGSDFTVTGMSPSGFNQTYVAVTGTSGTTIVGNPLTGPAGTPQANNPGASTGSGGSLASVVMPGMRVLGATGSAVVSPYGTFGSTGTGGTGSYGLTANQVSTGTATVTTITAPSGGSSTLTISGTPSSTIVVGVSLTFSTYGSNPMVVTGLGSGTGGAGTYTVSNANSGSYSGSGSATIAGTLGSSGSPVNIFAYTAFYYPTVAASTSPSGGSVGALSRASFGDFLSLFGANNALSPYGGIKSGWGGTIGNIAMLYGAFPQATGGAPSTASLASLCKKTTDIQSFASANSMTVNSLYRLNDLGIFGDSGAADFTGYISAASGTSGGTATLNLTTAGTGATTVAAMPSNAYVSGAGIPGCPSSCPKLTTPSTGQITFGSGITSANVASGGSPIALKAGAFAPLTPLQSVTLSGYIDNGSGSTPTLHVLSLPTSPGFAGADFTASLGTQFTASIASGTNQLVVTLPVSSGVNEAPIGLGMTVNIPGGTPSTAHVQSMGTALGFNGTYTLDATVTGASTSETMFGTCTTPAVGCLPGAPTALFNVSGVTGAMTAGQFVTDGGVNLTAQPLLITSQISSTAWTVAGNYYPSFLNDTGMVSSLSFVVPGEYIQNASIATPVKILNYQPTCSSGTTPTGAVNGGIGCYTLSAYPGSIASSGSPATFTGTTISDGGAIAPGPALTIRDPGPGIIYPVAYPVTCSALGSFRGTGSLFFTGTYDTSALGGAPSTLQAEISLVPGGPPVPGCSACAWTNLTGYSATLSSGTIYNWSGSAANISANSAPLFVSVRAANGTAYATMPNSIKVGLPFEEYGQGQMAAWPSSQSGVNWSYFSGLWGLVARHTPDSSGDFGWFTGPPITGNFVPGQSASNAGDAFGISGNGQPLSEGVGSFEQLLLNAFGWVSSVTVMDHDGVGNLLMTLGNVTQTQTVGVGNGSQTTWCSAGSFCSNVSGSGPLYFNAATQTGATLAGATISLSGGVYQLNVPASTGLVQGALEPGMTLSDTASGVIGTLSYCISGCTISAYAAGGPTAQTWATTATGAVSSTTITATPTGGAPWAGYNIQGGGLPFVTASSFGAQLIKAGTFTLTVNGTVVCQDNQAFADNNTGGNCTGAGIASSFVNYQTGDYQVTFSAAPANNAVIVASWTNIISAIPVTSTQYTRSPNVDYFGDSTGATSGMIAGMMAKTPGGLAGHINGGCSTDEGLIINSSSPTRPGYQFGAPGYAEHTSWLYDTKFPNVFPGFSATTPQIVALQFRDEGPEIFTDGRNGLYQVCNQWGQDFATKSTFNGTISIGVLTLNSNAVGPMWEGEVIGITGQPSPTGIYIENLCTVATCGAASTQGWGVRGSTYAISNPSSISASNVAMYNDVAYKGSGPVINIGGAYDINVQNTGLSSTTGLEPHMANGLTGGRRFGARIAAAVWGGYTNTTGAVNPPNASPPSLDRVKADAGGCDSSAMATPCLDVGTTYNRTYTPTASSGAVMTFNGLTAHSLPIVVGQAVSCSGCASGLFVKSVSNPPTQSTVAGAGQVGSANNGFTVTLNASSGWTSGGVTFGCSGTAGVGSNCIDMAFSINTTSGTFGTAAALATCGANNLNGTAPNYSAPRGVCQDNGIGEITRGFIIGPNVTINGVAGDVLDDGVNYAGGAFNQSAASTCNIVAGKVIQCVKGPAYTEGQPVALGLWTSSAQTWSSASVASAAYTSSTGNLALTFASAPFGASVGSTLDGALITVSGLAGAGSVASLNGTWAITSTGSSGTVVNLGAPAGLTATITSSTGSIAAGNGTFVNYGPTTAISGRLGGLVGYVGGQSFPFTAGSGYTNGTYTIQATCATTAVGGYAPRFDVTVAGGAIVDVVGSAAALGTGSQSPGLGVGSTCTVPITALGSGSGGSINTIQLAPPEGEGGIATFSTDTNQMGMFLYDNTGFVGNPLNLFFTNGMGGYFEPGLPVKPFGFFHGALVSG